MSAALHRLARALWLLCLLWLPGALPGGPPPAVAGVLLVPNGAAAPGELGFGMGGAQAALASGGEALWYNPAGLANERGSRLTLSGELLRWQTSAGDGPAVTSAGLGLGSVAYAHALGSRRGYPRFTLGLSLALTADPHLPSQIAGPRTGSAASLPPGLSVDGSTWQNGTVLDGDFPSGLALSDSGDALGELRVFTPSLGLGIATSDWLRLGLALHVERISFSERLTRATTYSGSDASNKLSGTSLLAWSVTGEALRLTPALGVQLDLSGSLLLGITLVLPAQSMAGSGHVHYQRSDAFAWDVGGGPQSAAGTVLVDRSGQAFRLDSPQRTQVGLAWRSDTFLVEFDVYRSGTVGSYTVLPAADSVPPSDAFTLPALHTSANAVLGFAVGMAYAQSERTSLLLSLAVDPSPVPADDPLYRSVTFVTVGAGAYHVRGDLSLSIGLVLREGHENAVSFAAPDGGQAVLASATIRQVAVQFGTSLAF
jgi:hypothetical protein